MVVETIAATTTKTGLRIREMLDTNTYEKGIKITDQEMKAFEIAHLQRHDFTASGTTPCTPLQVRTRHTRISGVHFCVLPHQRHAAEHWQPTNTSGSKESGHYRV